VGSGHHQHLTIADVAHAVHRVLIVDDDSDTVSATSMLLSLWGCESTAVIDSSRAESAALTFRPDVILLDLAMPGMDGFEVARAIRRHPEFDHTKIIAVSGFAQEMNRAKAKAAGIDCYFVKPVTPDDLHQELDEEVKH
jgi:CheY-like chemotaxis protein